MWYVKLSKPRHGFRSKAKSAVEAYLVNGLPVFVNWVFETNKGFEGDNGTYVGEVLYVAYEKKVTAEDFACIWGGIVLSLSEFKQEFTNV